MSELEGLCVGHQQLADSVTLLEDALRGAQGPQSIHEICHVLVRRLDTHLREEGDLMERSCCRLSRVPYDHVDAQAVLRDLDRLFLAQGQVPTGVLVDALWRLLQELREYLGEEEREILPALRYATSAHAA